MMEFDFSPFARSSIGFDRMFSALESGLRLADAEAVRPPYNIVRTGDRSYRIDLAVAGFTPDELTVTAQQNILIVGGKKAEKTEGDVLYRGIQAGSFERRFSLADFVRVASANCSNGVLSVDLVREIPDEMKPRRVPIGDGAQATPTTIEHQPA